MSQHDESLDHRNMKCSRGKLFSFMALFASPSIIATSETKPRILSRICIEDTAKIVLRYIIFKLHVHYGAEVNISR